MSRRFHVMCEEDKVCLYKQVYLINLDALPFKRIHRSLVAGYPELPVLEWIPLLSAHDQNPKQHTFEDAMMPLKENVFFGICGQPRLRAHTHSPFVVKHHRPLAVVRCSSPIHFVSFLRSDNHPLLPPERASFGQPCLATGGLTQHLRAAGADDDALCVREDGGDCEAAGALDIHEEASRSGDESLERPQCQSSFLLAVLFQMWLRTLSLCLRASATGEGLRRSTARTCESRY